MTWSTAPKRCGSLSGIRTNETGASTNAERKYMFFGGEKSIHFFRQFSFFSFFKKRKNTIIMVPEHLLDLLDCGPGNPNDTTHIYPLPFGYVEAPPSARDLNPWEKILFKVNKRLVIAGGRATLHVPTRAMYGPIFVVHHMDCDRYQVWSGTQRFVLPRGIALWLQGLNCYHGHLIDTKLPPEFVQIIEFLTADPVRQVKVLRDMPLQDDYLCLYDTARKAMESEARETEARKALEINAQQTHLMKLSSAEFVEKLGALIEAEEEEEEEEEGGKKEKEEEDILSGILRSEEKTFIADVRRFVAERLKNKSFSKHSYPSWLTKARELERDVEQQSRIGTLTAYTNKARGYLDQEWAACETCKFLRKLANLSLKEPYLVEWDMERGPREPSACKTTFLSSTNEDGLRLQDLSRDDVAALIRHRDQARQAMTDRRGNLDLVVLPPDRMDPRLFFPSYYTWRNGQPLEELAKQIAGVPETSTKLGEYADGTEAARPTTYWELSPVALADYSSRGNIAALLLGNERSEEETLRLTPTTDSIGGGDHVVLVSSQRELDEYLKKPHREARLPYELTVGNKTRLQEPYRHYLRIGKEMKAAREKQQTRDETVRKKAHEAKTYEDLMRLGSLDELKRIGARIGGWTQDNEALLRQAERTTHIKVLVDGGAAKIRSAKDFLRLLESCLEKKDDDDEDDDNDDDDDDRSLGDATDDDDDLRSFGAIRRVVDGALGSIARAWNQPLERISANGGAEDPLEITGITLLPSNETIVELGATPTDTAKYQRALRYLASISPSDDRLAAEKDGLVKALLSGSTDIAIFDQEEEAKSKRRAVTRRKFLAQLLLALPCFDLTEATVLFALEKMNVWLPVCADSLVIRFARKPQQRTFEPKLSFLEAAAKWGVEGTIDLDTLLKLANSKCGGSGSGGSGSVDRKKKKKNDSEGYLYESKKFSSFVLGPAPLCPGVADKVWHCSGFRLYTENDVQTDFLVAAVQKIAPELRQQFDNIWESKSESSTAAADVAPAAADAATAAATAVASTSEIGEPLVGDAETYVQILDQVTEKNRKRLDDEMVRTTRSLEGLAVEEVPEEATEILELLVAQAQSRMAQHHQQKTIIVDDHEREIATLLEKHRQSMFANHVREHGQEFLKTIETVCQDLEAKTLRSTVEALKTMNSEEDRVKIIEFAKRDLEQTVRTVVEDAKLNSLTNLLNEVSLQDGEESMDIHPPAASWRWRNRRSSFDVEEEEDDDDEHDDDDENEEPNERNTHGEQASNDSERTGEAAKPEEGERERQQQQQQQQQQQREQERREKEEEEEEEERKQRQLEQQQQQQREQERREKEEEEEEEERKQRHLEQQLREQERRAEEEEEEKQQQQRREEEEEAAARRQRQEAEEKGEDRLLEQECIKDRNEKEKAKAVISAEKESQTEVAWTSPLSEATEEEQREKEEEKEQRCVVGRGCQTDQIEMVERGTDAQKTKTVVRKTRLVFADVTRQPLRLPMLRQ